MLLVRDILEGKGHALTTVPADAYLSDCIVTMADKGLGSLPVMDRGKLVGLLTFREVIQVLASADRSIKPARLACVNGLRARNVMNARPVTTTPDVPLDELRALMLTHHQRYMPVLENGLLVGILSFHDIARTVFENTCFENRMLKAYIREWPLPEAA